MRVALVVDNPHRDLPGLVLLGSRLGASGATAYLVPMNLQEEEVSALAPDLVVLNCLRRTNQDLARRFLEAGIRLAVLDTEGGVMEDPGLYGRVMAGDASLRSRVSLLCCWGERLAAAVRRGGWYPDEAVRVTGAPRFDLYSPPWRRAAVALAPEAGGSAAPVVLINSSFTLANPRFKTVEQESGMLVERLGLDRAKVMDRLAKERQGLEGFLELAGRLAERLPEVRFVYRPHPFERIETYAELGRAHGNLEVSSEGTVDGWLLASRALIQLSSTTAVEAALAGAPALSTDWLPTWHRLEPVEAVARSCESAAELERELRRILDGEDRSELSPEARRVIREWFHELDGEAHRRVAAALEEVMDRPGPVVDLGRCRRLHYGTDRGSLRRRLGGAARRVLRLPRSWSFRRMRRLGPTARWDRSRKAFDLATVVPWLQGFAGVAPELSGVAARPAAAGADYAVPRPDGRSVVIERDD